MQETKIAELTAGDTMQVFAATPASGTFVVDLQLSHGLGSGTEKRSEMFGQFEGTPSLRDHEEGVCVSDCLRWTRGRRKRTSVVC